MNIIVVDVKENKKKVFRNVRTVKNLGFDFMLIFHDGRTQQYSFKDHDFFVNADWWAVISLKLNTYHRIYSASDLIKMAQDEIDKLEREYGVICKRIEQMNDAICSAPKDIADSIRSERQKPYNKRGTVTRRIKRNKSSITNYKANYTQKIE